MSKHGVKIGNIRDLGHKYEKGTLYYFKGNGDIFKSPMAVGGKVNPPKTTPMDERREMNGTKPKKTAKVGRPRKKTSKLK